MRRCRPSWFRRCPHQIVASPDCVAFTRTAALRLASRRRAHQLVDFEDGTIGLRFQYPKGWRCRGTGALMGLVAGNRVTTCADEAAKDGAVVGIEWCRRTTSSTWTSKRLSPGRRPRDGRAAGDRERSPWPRRASARPTS